MMEIGALVIIWCCSHFTISSYDDETLEIGAFGVAIISPFHSFYSKS